MASNQYTRILKKFRSQAHFCEVIGVGQSTVSSWKEAGRIPSKRIEHIIAKAAAANIWLDFSDFFPRAARTLERKTHKDEAA